MIDTHRLAARPTLLHVADTSADPVAAQFQHTVLRPILKLLNDRLVACFTHYTAQRKQPWARLLPKDKAAFIEHSIKTDQRLQARYIGMVIGWFTTDEYTIYLQEEQEINRRLRTLLIQRLQDQLIGK